MGKYAGACCKPMASMRTASCPVAFQPTEYTARRVLSPYQLGTGPYI